MSTLIAMPVFNEARHIHAVLDRVFHHHDQVLVIDDGSTDDTPRLLDQRPGVRVLRHPTNLGYGKSLIDAFAFAARRGFEWVITMDCDDQHEPEMIPVFLEQIARDDADLISGSRYLKIDDAVGLPPPERRMINLTITSLINALFGWNLTDTFCGFKAHRVAPTVRLGLDEPGYAFPLQLWPRVYAAGLRVREIPVRLIYNDPNRTFGNGLDDARQRLAHYLDVLNAELKRPGLRTIVNPSTLEQLRPARQACCC